MSSYFWPVALLVASVLLLVMEVTIPSGGILGVLGVLAVLGSIVAAFLKVGVTAGIAFISVFAVLIPAMVFLLVRIWPMTPMGKRILIRQQNGSDVIPQRIRNLRELIGQPGMAISPMLPSGAIRINGRNMDAVSDGIPINKGDLVEIVAVRGNHLVVRPSDRNKSTSGGRRSDEPLIADPFDDPVS